MNISSYEDLLLAANRQPEPQRLLFVFTRAELPGGHTSDQEKRFKDREGGTLTPVMCVDKLPGELNDFAGLVEESRQTGMGWDIVFVASMSTKSAAEPNSDEAEQPLKTMVEDIKKGKVGNFLAFNRDGTLVKLRAF
ncbi:MAG: ribonucleotide reductase subunit alpha [Gallionella sp.]|nr:MAG: ribonucleotide reductase subunit alpha [Gallionella sp.]